MGTVVATSKAAVGGTATAPSVNRGLVGARYQYTPYGEVDAAFTTGDTGDTRSELGYTNALRLTGSLLHLKARVYDAALRVFVQADTVDRLRYTYAAGDPANLSDPTGLMPIGGSGGWVDPAAMKSWGGVGEFEPVLVLMHSNNEPKDAKKKEDGSPASTPAPPVEQGSANPAPPAAGQAEPPLSAEPRAIGASVPALGAGDLPSAGVNIPISPAMEPIDPGNLAQPMPGSVFDDEAAANYMLESALPTYNGQCGAFTRRGVEAGFANSVAVETATFAAEYGPNLEHVGFRLIATISNANSRDDDQTEYTSRRGDVAVFDATTAHPAGHAQMNVGGNQWVSDAAQNHFCPYTGGCGAARVYRWVGFSP